LDSFAFLAFLGEETGVKRVQEILSLSKDKKIRLIMCDINLGEVLYITERNRGFQAAQKVLGLIECLPIEIIETNRALILDAAHIKANYALSYADAFIVAESIHENAIVLTGDPEFKTVANLINLEWIAK
jgi:predicted nucleic acid-binding protein